MYLAQISRGQDSVKLYNKGIEIIKKSIEVVFEFSIHIYVLLAYFYLNIPPYASSCDVQMLLSFLCFFLRLPTTQMLLLKIS